MVLARIAIFAWDIAIAMVDGSPLPSLSLDALSAGLPALLGLGAAWVAAAYSLLVMISAAAGVSARDALGGWRLEGILLPLALGTLAEMVAAVMVAAVCGARTAMSARLGSRAAWSSLPRAMCRGAAASMRRTITARICSWYVGIAWGAAYWLAVSPGSGKAWTLTLFAGIVAVGPAVGMIVAFGAASGSLRASMRVTALMRAHSAELGERARSMDAPAEPPLVIAQRESDVRVARAEATYLGYWAVAALLSAIFGAATLWQVASQLTPLVTASSFTAAATAIGTSANQPWAPPGAKPDVASALVSTYATRIVGLWMATQLALMVGLVALAHGLQDLWDADDARVIRPETMSVAQQRALVDATGGGDEAVAAVVRALVPCVLELAQGGVFRRRAEDAAGRALGVQIITNPLHLIAPVQEAMSRQRQCGTAIRTASISGRDKARARISEILSEVTLSEVQLRARVPQRRGQHAGTVRATDDNAYCVGSFSRLQADNKLCIRADGTFAAGNPLFSNGTQRAKQDVAGEKSRQMPSDCCTIGNVSAAAEENPMHASAALNGRLWPTPPAGRRGDRYRSRMVAHNISGTIIPSISLTASHSHSSRKSDTACCAIRAPLRQLTSFYDGSHVTAIHEDDVEEWVAAPLHATSAYGAYACHRARTALNCEDGGPANPRRRVAFAARVSHTRPAVPLLELSTTTAPHSSRNLQAIPEEGGATNDLHILRDDVRVTGPESDECESVSIEISERSTVSDHTRKRPTADILHHGTLSHHELDIFSNDVTVGQPLKSYMASCSSGTNVQHGSSHIWQVGAGSIEVDTMASEQVRFHHSQQDTNALSIVTAHADATHYVRHDNGVGGTIASRTQLHLTTGMLRVSSALRSFAQTIASPTAMLSPAAAPNADVAPIAVARVVGVSHDSHDVWSRSGGQHSASPSYGAPSPLSQRQIQQLRRLPITPSQARLVAARMIFETRSSMGGSPSTIRASTASYARRSRRDGIIDGAVIRLPIVSSQPAVRASTEPPHLQRLSSNVKKRSFSESNSWRGSGRWPPGSARDLGEDVTGGIGWAASLTRHLSAPRIVLPTKLSSRAMQLTRRRGSAAHDLSLIRGASSVASLALLAPATCFICFDDRPDAVFMECGHAGVCLRCANTITHGHVDYATGAVSGGTGTCPVCRAPVFSVLRVGPKVRATDGSTVVQVLHAALWGNARRAR